MAAPKLLNTRPFTAVIVLGLGQDFRYRCRGAILDSNELLVC
jgi:hypothetical protein